MTFLACSFEYFCLLFFQVARADRRVSSNIWSALHSPRNWQLSSRQTEPTPCLFLSGDKKKINLSKKGRSSVTTFTDDVYITKVTLVICIFYVLCSFFLWPSWNCLLGKRAHLQRFYFKSYMYLCTEKVLKSCAWFQVQGLSKTRLSGLRFCLCRTRESRSQATATDWHRIV